MKPIFYFLGVGVSISLSVYIFIFGTAPNHENIAIFIGLWAPTIIGIGIYNELSNIYDELLRRRRDLTEQGEELPK